MLKLAAELLICLNEVEGLFEYNAAYLRDGGEANTAGGWQSAGTYPSVHDALTEGKRWLDDAKLCGLKRGCTTGVPRIWKAVA